MLKPLFVGQSLFNGLNPVKRMSLRQNKVARSADLYGAASSFR